MRTLLAILGLLAFFCDIETVTHDDPVAPLSLEHNSVKIAKGDSWLFKRQFINILDSGRYDFPDTLTGYSYFSAVKDTSIEGKTFVIIEGSDFDIGKDSVTTIRKRSAIHSGDTVILYEFRNNQAGFLSGVMKRQADDGALTLSNFGTFSLKKAIQHKFLATSNYDPAVFSDLVYPMIFPLKNDSIYTYREADSPSGNTSCRRRFLGIEDLSIGLGTFQAYKFEFLCAQEVYNITDTYFYDWIGSNGVLKRYINSGLMNITDPSGTTIGKVRTSDLLELIGHSDIDPDTLKPWSRK